MRDDLFRAIDGAFQDHKVLDFPDQEMTPAQHVAFNRRFGDLETHVLTNNLLGKDI